jgi:hypothetical protein
MDLYQSFIAKSRYARYLPEENRREEWVETVARYFDFFEKHLKKNNNYTLTSKLRKELEDAVVNLEVMPSMRCLMTAGKALERNNIAGYNCSYLAVDDPKSFDEAMMILLCGTGVGFSVERQDIAKLPLIPNDWTSGSHIKVGDSKEGWVKALRLLITNLYKGRKPTWDVSAVRPAGTPLKTFGGRASGPEPLVELFEFVISTFKEAKGGRLNSLQCHDIMCKIGETVVVGGVRRSAMISLSNLSDRRMQGAKMGAWWEKSPQRALANNSICYTEKPDVNAFMKEWLALYESKSGERGIFNRVASEKQVLKNGRRKGGYAWGTNPCCFTGDMKLLTDKGYMSFFELSGKDVNIINDNGDVSFGKVWSSDIKEIVEVKFLNGMKSIKCTPDHIFKLNNSEECQARDLQGKRLKPFFKLKKEFDRESFFAGFIQGDGAINRLSSKDHKGLEIYIGEKDKDVGDLLGFDIGTHYSREAHSIATKYKLHPSTLPSRNLPEIMDTDFISGLYSANGCIIKGHRIAFKSTCEELIFQLQDHLKGIYNIDSYITINKPTEVKFSNGSYLCKKSYDLNISKREDITKFSENISFAQKYKQDDLTNLILLKAPYVCSVKKLGQEEVFDFTEPKNHWGIVEGVIVHNSEIILRPEQFCNLSEVVVRSNDTLKSLLRKVELATILGTFQSTLINLPYLRKVWTKNTEEERLLGVSLTGIMDNKMMVDNSRGNLASCLKSLKVKAIQTNASLAKELGIPQSAAINCVKPSGTVSQLVDSASGIHTRHAPYYIRRVRGDIKDPLTQFLIDKGVDHEPCVMKPNNTVVFSFPKKAPEGALINITAIEHLELWLTYQREWCEHKPSITVSVKENEWPEVGAWVWNHFDEVSGISFLPDDGGSYRQAPYEEIDKVKYEEMFARSIKEIDWSQMKEISDTTEGTQTLACTGGSCEI